MKVVVSPTQKWAVKGVLVRTRESAEWKCLLLPVSYCCPILEGNDMWDVRYDIVLNGLRDERVVTSEDVWGVGGQCEVSRGHKNDYKPLSGNSEEQYGERRK